jgi:hypothetical protein
MFVRLEGSRHSFGMMAWVACDIYALHLWPAQQFLQVIRKVNDGVALGKVPGAAAVIAVNGCYPGPCHIARARQRRLVAQCGDHVLGRHTAGARY